MKKLVRSCELTYNEEELLKEKIEVEELIFEDGQVPSKQIQQRWLDIVDEFFDSPADGGAAAKEQGVLEDGDKKLSAAASKSSRGKSAANSGMSAGQNKQVEKRIAVHCVAGLGRASFLVALALVHKGAQPINTINLIRNHRKGALNPIQANYIKQLKAGKVLGGKSSSGDS